MQRHAFVTGGSGFIGINLIKLLLDSDWTVTALHRSTSDLRYLENLPVDLREGSITDSEQLQKVMPDKADAVFHLAGDTNLWAKNNDSQAMINVDGTRNVLAAAQSKDASAFIYTSSASVWGEMTGKHISETVPKMGMDSWVNYERTKWAAEQEVLKYSDSKMKVVILNPTTVTGPYDINNWGRIFLALKDKELPGIPDGIISVTHVTEVAKAHIVAVDRGKNGENYILSGVDCTFSQFISEIAQLMGIHKMPKKIPAVLLKSLAYYHSFVSSITGQRPDLTPELAKIMTRKNISYSSDKAIADLGYKIEPMKKSVRDCYNWLSKEGHL
jgi:dihydroflavonol-4-reductase